MDKYDKAIEYLTAYPDEIYQAWAHPIHHEAGCLFGYCTKDGMSYKGDEFFGCLTQCKVGNNGFGDKVTAETPELFAAIQADERIPVSPPRAPIGLEIEEANKWNIEHCTIKLEHLPVFAEWQRRMDRGLNREV